MKALFGRLSAPARGRIGDRAGHVRQAIFAALFAVLTTAVVTSTSASTSVRPVKAALIDSSTTTTAPAPVAPPGFASQLTDLYTAAYSIDSALPSSASSAPPVATPSQFANQVGALSQDQLNGIYQSSQQYTDLSALTQSIQQVGVDVTSEVHSLRVRVSRTNAIVSHVVVKVGHSLVGRDVTGAVVVQSLTTIPPSEPTTGSFANDVSAIANGSTPDGNSYIATCPPGAPTSTGGTYGENDIYAIGIAIDVSSALYNVFGMNYPTDYVPIIGPASEEGRAAVAAVFAVISGVLEIAHDSLSFVQSVSSDCQTYNTGILSRVESNTAYQNYQLLTQIAATTNEIDSNVANLTNQEAAELAKLTTLEIEQALSAPVGSVPDARMELTAPAGLLDSTPGVEEIVVATIGSLQSEGQLTSSAATRDLGLAEQAQAAGQYKLAFDYYRMAYQAASS